MSSYHNSILRLVAQEKLEVCFEKCDNLVTVRCKRKCKHKLTGIVASYCSNTHFGTQLNIGSTDLVVKPSR